MLVDKYGRKIDYLRISVTDHCNLRCGYCMPDLSMQQHLHRSEILSFEELYQLSSVAVSAGIEKIRITGGEPLVRNDIVKLCQMIAKITGLKELTLTTNGVKLKQLAEPLFQAGVKRINISLDTLNREKFKKITGKDRLLNVLAGIQEAQRIGMTPIKINTVVMRGVNDDEVPNLASLSVNNPYQIRFIEIMPFSNTRLFNYKQMYVPIEEIKQRIPSIDRANIVFPQKRSGPAKVFALPGAKGCIGFIAPVSQHICRNCNRLRLTANGRLNTCLFLGKETDLKSLLRKGASNVDLVETINKATLQKPKQHCVSASFSNPMDNRKMYVIGG